MAIGGVQDHIHLGIDFDDDGPEYAPLAKWKTIARKEIPVAFINVRRSRKGYLLPNVVLNSEGNVFQPTNWLYRVKVTADDDDTVEERKALLKSFQGQYVWLVDHVHPADGEDHSSYVQDTFCSRVGEFDAGEDMGLRFFYVEVELEDAT